MKRRFNLGRWMAERAHWLGWLIPAAFWATVMVIILSGCVAAPTWKAGPAVDPPPGCVDLRQRTGNPDEC